MAVLYSNLAQHTLSQSVNISYLIRNATRMNAVPDDRQGDYSFRDLFLTIINTATNEWAMRTTEAVYSAPNYVRLLGFHNFAKEYQGIPGAQNYTLLPRALESRMLGLLASEKSFYQIGNLLSHYDTRKLKPGSPEYNELKLLGEHCERRFDPRNYFHAYYKLDADTSKAAQKADALQAVLKSAKDDDLKHFAVDHLGQTPKTPSKEAKQVLERLFSQHEKTLSEAFGANWKQQILSHVSHGKDWDKSVPELIRDGLSSRFVQQGVAHARKSGSILKLIAALISNTVVYAIIGNWLDFNVVQPWQEKFVKQRGTTKELVSPQIWSLIPASAAFIAMHFATKKVPGYAARFGLNIGSALVTYLGVTAFWLKKRLSEPPKGKYAKYAEHGLHEQQAHQMLNKSMEKTPPQYYTQFKKHNPFETVNKFQGASQNPPAK